MTRKIMEKTIVTGRIFPQGSKRKNIIAARNALKFRRRFKNPQSFKIKTSRPRKGFVEFTAERARRVR